MTAVGGPLVQIGSGLGCFGPGIKMIYQGHTPPCSRFPASDHVRLESDVGILFALIHLQKPLRPAWLGH